MRASSAVRSVRPLSVAVVTLGCPKNQVDSEVMRGLLARDGFRLIEQPERADVVVVNTCGFIDQAKEESIDTIVRLAKLKQSGRCRVLIATGCLTQRYSGELLKEIPELDGVTGTGDFQTIAEICRERLAPAKTTVPISLTEQMAFLYDDATPRHRIGPKHSAYVKVSEGCNYRCSFCAIPSFRGDLKSRPIDSVVREVEQLAKEGVKEINLIAQSLTSYGWDWRDKSALVRLLAQLAPVAGIEWIRLFYTYPTDFTDELIELLAKERKLCRYVDLPLQHINDRLLKAMNRKGSRRDIEQLIERLRKAIPDLALRTTFIVGFPGEGEAEVEELEEFVRAIGFDRIGVFTYSPEEGTAAFALGDPVSAEEKAERRQRLLDLQEEIAGERLAAMIGKKLRVLVDGPADDGSDRLEARHQGQAPEIDGVVLLEQSKKQPSPGDLVTVEITDTIGYDLVGRVTPM
ncbi:MAG: 30S ribosomal protein S12 methylthiotransferase RimO [Nitrospirota bacterium]